MITIIHGDDIVSSRKQFLSEREKSQSQLVLDGENISLTDLIQTSEGSLFGSQKTIFIENLFERKGKESEAVFDYLKQQKTSEIILWEGKELTGKVLSVFPNPKVITFKLPKLLFPFLDSIRPGNGRNLITLFHNVLKNTEPEIVFYMLVRQFRLLLAFSDYSSKNQIDEVTRLAPWQKEKLRKQKTTFSQERLKEVFDKLYGIDLGQKTGDTSLSLVQAIDFFLIDL